MDAEAAVQSAVRLAGPLLVGWRGERAREEAVLGEADEDVAGRLPPVEVHLATGHGEAGRGVRSHRDAGGCMLGSR